MSKKLLISVFSLILVFALWLLAPAPAYADRLEVLPTDHDFGDVEVGTTVTTIISMTNINGSPVTVFRIEFQAGGSEDFSVMSAPLVPFDLAPNEVAEVEVAFTPSAAGYVSAVLEIESSDMIEPLQTVFLGGVGVSIQPPPPSIEPILAFFDASVEAGTLDGRGELAIMARARLRAMRNLLKAAGDFIEGGYMGWACFTLRRAYLRSDGLRRPPDFVEGDARAELNGMIGQLIADLGCN